MPVSNLQKQKTKNTTRSLSNKKNKSYRKNNSRNNSKNKKLLNNKKLKNRSKVNNKKFVQNGGFNGEHTSLEYSNHKGGKLNVDTSIRAFDLIFIIILIAVLGIGYLILTSAGISFNNLITGNHHQQLDQPYISSGVVINPSLEGSGIHISDVRGEPHNVYLHARKRMDDPLLPPERSNPRTSPFSIDVSKVGIPINVPTRGESGPYQQIGYLQDTEEKILPLFGKQVYPGSNKWNYYTSTDQYNQVKIPVMLDSKNCTSEHGCTEISQGDPINVPSYPNRDFTASIYELDAPRYIPY